MSVKTKTIIVSAGWRVAIGDKASDGYRVEKVTNSIEHTPHDLLTKEQVESLCSNTRWNVTVIAFPSK